MLKLCIVDPVSVETKAKTSDRKTQRSLTKVSAGETAFVRIFQGVRDCVRVEKMDLSFMLPNSSPYSSVSDLGLGSVKNLP